MTNSLQIDRNEQTAQLVWTVIIVSFFLIQAVIWTVAISITSNDQSHVVLADYDQKSLHWDESQASRRASKALGWKTSLKIATAADIVGNRSVTLTLHDRNDQPIQQPTVDLIAFHRGQAANQQSIRLQATLPGIYEGVVQIRKQGQWQFSGTIRNSGDQFYLDEKQFIELVRK